MMPEYELKKVLYKRKRIPDAIGDPGKVQELYEKVFKKGWFDLAEFIKEVTGMGPSPKTMGKIYAGHMNHNYHLEKYIKYLGVPTEEVLQDICKQLDYNRWGGHGVKNLIEFGGKYFDIKLFPETVQEIYKKLRYINDIEYLSDWTGIDPLPKTLQEMYRDPKPYKKVTENEYGSIKIRSYLTPKELCKLFGVEPIEETVIELYNHFIKNGDLEGAEAINKWQNKKQGINFDQEVIQEIYINRLKGLWDIIRVKELTGIKPTYETVQEMYKKYGLSGFDDLFEETGVEPKRDVLKQKCLKFIEQYGNWTSELQKHSKWIIKSGLIPEDITRVYRKTLKYDFRGCWKHCNNKYMIEHLENLRDMDLNKPEAIKPLYIELIESGQINLIRVLEEYTNIEPEKWIKLAIQDINELMKGDS